MTNYEAAKRLMELYADHLHLYDSAPNSNDSDSIRDVITKAIFALAGGRINDE